MISKFLSKVTVTGADDSVNPKELIAIAKEFPFVEFGILVSKRSTGQPRFPSYPWIENFSKDVLDSRLDINVSGHLCGSWVNEAFLGRWISLDLPKDFSHVVKRWQLNTHGGKVRCIISSFMNIIKAVNSVNQQIIFQYDEANTDLIVEAIKHNLNVSALYDLSHGAGLLPNEWKMPVDLDGNFLSNKIPLGFAGGMSPENVNEEIEKICNNLQNYLITNSILSSQEIWIDAETKLRSISDSFFDLDKVVKFLEAAKPWVRDGENND
jgi:hypothetical protein